MIEQCVLIIALHGASGNGPAMEAILPPATNPSWQFVYPSSPTTVWDLSPGSDGEKTLVNIARKSNCDTKVVTGFSNGGYMASVLLCRYPKLFDAAFSVNGVTRTAYCPVPSSSHFSAISGETDNIVYKNGQVAPGVEPIIPPWARVPAKETVKSVAVGSGEKGKAKVTDNSTYRKYRWGNFTWSLEYDTYHQWTANTTGQFVNFVKGVVND